MDSTRYKAFLAAAEEGSFTKAADKLSYTPSGVSQLISALEEDLGLALFTRSKKGVSLTAAGNAILPSARELIQQEEHILQTASELNDLLSGIVSIATYSSISTHWLPRVISAFEKDYPGVQIQLFEGVWQEVAERLDSGKADLGFLSHQDNMPYDWIALADDPMIAVLPKSHPLAGAEYYPLERCYEDPLIMPALGRDYDVIAMFERNKLSPKIRFSTIETYSAMTMIEQGLGVAFSNELLTLRFDADIVRVPVYPEQHITLGIALNSLDFAPPAVRKFVEYAVRELQSDMYRR